MDASDIDNLENYFSDHDLSNYKTKVKVRCNEKQAKTFDKQKLIDLGFNKVEMIAESKVSKDIASVGIDEKYDKQGIKKEYLSFCEEIPELDVKTGLMYCAESKMFYLEMLEEFVNGTKDEELAVFLQNGDWDNYRIAVHAMKSNAKTIGAMELSEEARLQEMAAKENRTEDVAANHQALAEHYKDLQNRLRKVLG